MNARPDGPAAALLERAVDGTQAAMDRIDKDPEEALHALEPIIHAAPNVGEITPQDMFRLMATMQEQLAQQQRQILDLMGQQRTDQQSDRRGNLAEEVRRDKEQRDATLEAWRTEVREPVYIQPDADEMKIHKVTGKFPPRVFMVNGLEFPIFVGQICSVPQSIAVQVTWNQHQRQGPAQQIEAIDDPQRGQFLAGAQSISGGRFGQTGEGPLRPERGAASPQPLGYQYDHRGL